ncbi:hypothetical protein QLS91_17355, partial [Flavobacterium sp. LB2P84]|uniref:tail fiber domain-containing protein n=1 Tax=Flavobacterium yafengii TaxID=3041253 RepID=UPI0024A9DAE8
TATQTALNGKQASGSYETAFSKNTAFNKNFGTTAGTVAEGNDSRILNGQTAFSWGNHAGLYPTYNGTGANGTWPIGITGNAATATNSTLWNGGAYYGSALTPASNITYAMVYDNVNSRFGIASAGGFQSFLGLGSNAYNSTAYLPLTGGSVSGKTRIRGGNSDYDVSTSSFSIEKGIEGYGVYFGVSLAGGSYIQGSTLDGVTKYPLNLNPNGGNIGIGTTAPSTKLDLRGTSATTNSTIQIVGNSTSSLLLGQNADGGVIRGQGGNNALSFWTGGAGDVAASGSGSEKMRITSTGNVGIGTSSPQQKFVVSNSGQQGVEVYIESTTAMGIQSYNRSTSSYSLMKYDASSHLFNSNVTASAFFQSSDRRLKTILKRDGDVAYFKWKDNRDTKTHIGYIAQEVRKEFPDQVQKDEKGMLSVNYIEVLVAKIQDLEKRIKQLEK